MSVCCAGLFMGLIELPCFCVYLILGAAGATHSRQMPTDVGNLWELWLRLDLLSLMKRSLNILNLETSVMKCVENLLLLIAIYQDGQIPPLQDFHEF